ncbi:hypothetical protein ACFO3U_03440 [Flavobacterium ponti]|uniref:Uncharacterized protein n=1 Tax=Flavobacterium ponti TaxID=665133 RepID=A0ABV9P490_9FLAO
MKIYLFFLFLFFFSCKETSSNSEETNSFYQETETVEKITPDDIETITPEEAKTFHTNKEYEYEYRTGYSGNYEYNYDIIGQDEDGNEVTGNINIEDKYGAGKIEDKYGNEYDIEVEWYDYGKLKGTDENGIYYELTVE